jgi:hypothetical protein
VKVTPKLIPLVLLGLVTQALDAQGWQPRISGSASSITAVTVDADGRRVANGFGLGVEGSLSRGAVALTAGYGEGPVGPPASRMILGEGWVGAQLQLVPAFALRAGPVARVLVDDSLTVRWVHWRVTGRVTAPLAASDVFAYAEGWAGSGSRSGTTAGSSSATGGTVGLEWRHARGALRIEYAMDEARRPAAERLTIERLALVVELERR